MAFLLYQHFQTKGLTAMGKRKIIGVLLCEPESVYQQRVLRGIFLQCREYGYDAAVFASLTKPGLRFKDYQEGEENIFELPNFDYLDGVIVPAITFSDDRKLWDRILNIISEKCTKPVVSLDLPFGDYPVVNTDDRSSFSEITAHIIDVHGCSKIYFLTGKMGYTVSEQRLDGYKDMMNERNIPVTEDMIFYGDFWYTSGEALADRIASGEVEKPEAVICASDHMAIGLANRLKKHGIRIPEDIIVTGYDGTAEAVINDLTITTCIPDVGTAAAEAVNRLRTMIEPDMPIAPVPTHRDRGLRICSSCGCPENTHYIKNVLNSSLIHTNWNFGADDFEDKVDINLFLENYVFESYAGAENVTECFDKIFNTSYLIRPYYRFYLCLCDNWLNDSDDPQKGYTEKMKTVVFNHDGNDCNDCYFTAEGYVFESRFMLPQLFEQRDEPYVFYFAPVHYIEDSLGYAVLQCSLSQEHLIGNVYRNWLRNVSSALEMIRAKHRLQQFSEIDAMTGLSNRRGMHSQLERLMAKAKPSDKLLIFVIDMDGLKFINDTYGHSEGDYGIKALANITRQVAKNDEICVRAGGDEFYIIGVGDYTNIDPVIREQRFYQTLEEVNKAAAKPYEISASLGCCCESISHKVSFNDLLQIADGRMYENKTARKKQRST